MAGAQDWLDITRQIRVVGFTVCPPQGDDLTQEQISRRWKRCCSCSIRRRCTSCLKSPKTKSRPPTFLQLVERYPNLYLLKDTSGQDWIARAGSIPVACFWSAGPRAVTAAGSNRPEGLMTDCCSARQTTSLRSWPKSSDWWTPGSVNRPTPSPTASSSVVSRCFEIVAGVPLGNPFTNANKLLDHVLAYGAEAVRQPPPMLHGGTRLPRELIEPVDDGSAGAKSVPRPRIPGRRGPPVAVKAAPSGLELGLRRRLSSPLAGESLRLTGHVDDGHPSVDSPLAGESSG